MTITYAPRAYRALHGVFAVYKASGTSQTSLRSQIEVRLIADLNKLEQRPQKSLITFQPTLQQLLSDGHQLAEAPKTVEEGLDGRSNIQTIPTSAMPTLVPDWFDHPLVSGPRYTPDLITMDFGHMLDEKACGVQVVALQSKGQRTLAKLRKANTPRRYRIKGKFGQASLRFTDAENDRITQLSTWKHISSEKVQRVLASLQGTHRNALIESSGLDLSSQRAYLLACKGLLRPNQPTESVIIDVKLVDFQLPHFTIEAVVLNESMHFIRELIDAIGTSMKSNAVCTNLKRISDGIFTLKESLLPQQINANSVISAIEWSDRQLLQDRESPIMRRRKHYKMQKKSDETKPEKRIQSRHRDDSDDNWERELFADNAK